MQLDLSHFVFIDQHAHLLLKRHQELDALDFRKCLSESRSIGQLERHLPENVYYRHLISGLCRRFALRDEAELLEARAKLGAAKYIRELFDDAGIGGIICDTGFGRKEMVTLNELANLSGRTVWQALRIERVLEECIDGSSSFTELANKFSERLSQGAHAKFVSLKTICAYRGGLEIEPVSMLQARKDFDKQKTLLAGRKQVGINKCPLYHYFLWQAFELAACLGLPVQVHAGIGDDDADLRLSNPLFMRRILRAETLAKTNFVFLHSYPYVRETAFLCAIYPNVFMDLSLACLQASPAFPHLIYEALASAPATKILAGTDGHSIAESYWYGAHTWRQGLSSALGTMCREKLLSPDEAMSGAALILHDNAKRLYNLEGLF